MSTTAILGKVAMADKGVYSATEPYAAFDFVTTMDSAYISKKDNNVGNPVTDTTWWRCIFNGKPITGAATAALEAAAAAAPTVVNVEGAEVTLDVKASHKYLCGELTSLTISSAENSTREATIWFRSGAVATQLTMPQALSDKVIGYAVPAPNTDYEINLANGIPVIVHPC